MFAQNQARDLEDGDEKSPEKVFQNGVTGSLLPVYDYGKHWRASRHSRRTNVCCVRYRSP